MSNINPREASLNTQAREAAILAAMPKATASEQRALAQELEMLRRQRSASVRRERDDDVAKAMISDLLTPVVGHTAHTASTDWMGEMLPGGDDADAVHQAAKAEATQWVRRTSAAVREDQDEFTIQAEGYARVWGSQFGEYAPTAKGSFVAQAMHMVGYRTVAADEERFSCPYGDCDVVGTRTEMGNHIFNDHNGKMPEWTSDPYANPAHRASLTKTAARPLYEIADEIVADWKKPYFGAVPYIDALSSMQSINDMYGADEGRWIVAYFLSNATTWKGEVARRVKAELKAMMDGRSASLDKTGIATLVMEEGEPTNWAGEKGGADYVPLPWVYRSKDGTILGAYPTKERAEEEADLYRWVDFDHATGDWVASLHTSEWSGEKCDHCGKFNTPGRDRCAHCGGVGPGPQYKKSSVTAKYRAEVTGIGEEVWSGNGLEYDTPEEAQDWLNGLALRWFGYDRSRVVSTDVPRKQPVSADDEFYQNFRSAALAAQHTADQGSGPDDASQSGYAESEVPWVDVSATDTFELGWTQEGAPVAEADDGVGEEITASRRTATYAVGDRVEVTNWNGAPSQGVVTGVETNGVSGIEYILYAPDGSDPELAYPVYTNGVNNIQVRTLSSFRRQADEGFAGDLDGTMPAGATPMIQPGSAPDETAMFEPEELETPVPSDAADTEGDSYEPTTASLWHNL